MFPPVQEYEKAPEMSSTMTVRSVDMVDKVGEDCRGHDAVNPARSG